MKRILSVMICCLLCSTVWAGKIRPIIFADTNDDRIGIGVDWNLHAIQIEITQIASCIGMEDEIPTIYDGFKCTKENLQECIKNFVCDPDDIVIFCYFGHGGRSPQDVSRFPQMMFKAQNGSVYDSNLVPLEDVKDALMQKNPRLCIVLGDCCNSYTGGVTPKRYTLFPASESTTYDEKQEVAMKKLFLETKGYVISSGSKQGQASWYSVDPKEPFGFFTKNFIDELNFYTYEESAENISWENLMDRVSSEIENITKTMIANGENIEVQTPIFDVRINKDAPLPPTKEREINTLKQALVDLANENNSAAERIRNVDMVNRLFFAENAFVDVVGRDNTTIVESSSAIKFLRRISTAFRLKNFAIQKCETNAEGKVTYLKVHEIYSKQ